MPSDNGRGKGALQTYSKKMLRIAKINGGKKEKSGNLLVPKLEKNTFQILLLTMELTHLATSIDQIF